MWRGIVASLATALFMMGQAWAIPVDVSIAGMLDCSGPCAAGETLVASRNITGAPSNPDGAVFQDHYSFSLTGPVVANGTVYVLSDSGTLYAFR